MKTKAPVVCLAFEQQPKESAKAFAAFKLYLEMGPARSLEAVRVKLGKSARLIQRWSSRWRWGERVQAYSAYLGAIEREAIEGLVREKGVDWGKVHEAQKVAEWKLRTEYFELALEGIRRWKANGNRVGSLEGLARLGEVFVKLGRLASGMPTDSVEVTGEVKATLEIEWELALKKVYGGHHEIHEAHEKVIEATVVSAPEPSPGLGPPSPVPTGEGEGEAKP
jgi:hypothetical protein